jgi:hypothetical protein
MKFFAEAFNFRLINDKELWTLLYRIINYDYKTKLPLKGAEKMDSKDESFRVRMICTTLDSLGKYFQTMPRQSDLHRFLVFY